MSLRAFIASPLGFLVGLSLGSLGGGGSVLAVPALVYAAGQTPREATASSLLLVGVAALVGLRPHLRASRVRVSTGVAFGAAGVPGSLLGSAVNARLDPELLLLAFSGLIVVAAWRMVTGCPTCTAVGEAEAINQPPVGAAEPGADRGSGRGGARIAISSRMDTRKVAAVVAAGVGIGFLTGLFGVGGGFVIVPALTLLLRLNMPTAIGTSLVVVAINSGAGLVARLGTASIDWAVTVPFGVAAIAGVLTGGHLAGRLEPRRSLRAFAVLLVCVAIYTALRATLG